MMDQADRTCPRPCNIWCIFAWGGGEEKKEKENDINRPFGNLQVMKICQINKLFLIQILFLQKKSK